MSQLTVVVPTYNRYAKLHRLLAYRSSVEMSCPVWVLDSSSDPMPEGLLRRRLAENGVVHRRYDPATPPMEKLIDGLVQVSTPYVAVWDDDDFLVPGALEDGARFLDTHPDYSVVVGCSALIALDPPSMQGVLPYAHRAITGATAEERLRDHLRRYEAVLNPGVHRTALLTENIARCCRHKFGYRWGELVLGCFDVIQGKVHRLDRLYLVKELHNGPDAWISSLMPLGVVQPNGWRDQLQGQDVFGWIAGPHFSEDYAAFCECLAMEVVRVDGCDVMTAWEIVKAAFWSCTVQILVKKSRVQRGQTLPSRSLRLRSLVRSLPGARKAWRTAQTLLRSRRDISLDTFLQHRSPYHRDFMPIYEAIKRVDSMEVLAAEHSSSSMKVTV